VLSQKTESPFVFCNWKTYSSTLTKRIILLVKVAPLACSQQHRTPNPVVLKRMQTQFQRSRFGSIALSSFDVNTPFDRTC